MAAPASLRCDFFVSVKPGMVLISLATGAVGLDEEVAAGEAGAATEAEGLDCQLAHLGDLSNT